MKKMAHKILKCVFILFFIPLPLFTDNIEIDSKLPLGLAYDGSILWVGDAQNRSLTGYDFTQKKILATRILPYGIRDLAFWQPHLVTVAPNFIYVINPINGDLVDKIPLKGIDDPVAIALDMHQAYIFNRADKKIYRVHLVDRMQFGSFTPEIDTDVRGMTFYKGFLWVITKDNKAIKLSPKDGTQVSFLPLPQSTYGIAFIDGAMYVSRPGQVRSIDFIETENYVAAAKRNFTLSAKLGVALPWSTEDRLRESKMVVRFAILPMTAHQRLTGLRAKPTTRFQRQEDGAYTSTITLEQKSTEKVHTYELQFQATLFNLTHIFNGQLLRQYFKNPTLPDEVHAYLDLSSLNTNEKKIVDNFRNTWLKKNDGKHPIYAIAAVQKDTSIDKKLHCAIYRALGVPCRKMLFYDLDKNHEKAYLQVFIQPTGWVTITDTYAHTKPKEFPVANNELELYSPESTYVHPKPRVSEKLPPPLPASELLNFSAIRVITSSIE